MLKINSLVCHNAMLPRANRRMRYMYNYITLVMLVI